MWSDLYFETHVVWKTDFSELERKQDEQLGDITEVWVRAGGGSDQDGGQGGESIFF